MDKILLIVSAFAILGSAVLGVIKRQEHIGVRKEKNEINEKNRDRLDDFSKTLGADLEDLRGQLEKTYKERLITVASIDQRENSSIKPLRLEISQLKNDLLPLDNELAKVQQTLEELRKLPGVEDPDNIQKSVESLKQKRRELEDEVQVTSAELNQFRERKERLDTLVSQYRQRAQERAVKVARNGASFPVTAVNSEWGVVTFGAGENNGVDKDSIPLVKRGSTIVGQLEIVNVLPYKTVASIKMSSLAPGDMIVPGDQVMFQDTQK